MSWDLKLPWNLNVHSLTCLVVVASKLQIGCNLLFYPILFVLPFKFVKYINKCTLFFLKITWYGISQEKKSLALEVKSKRK